MQPEKFLENFSTHLKNTIARSISITTRLGAPEVNPIHLLLAISEEQGSVAAEILKRIKFDWKFVLEREAKKALKNPAADSKQQKVFPELSLKAKQVLEKAMLAAYEEAHQYVGTEHLLYGLLFSKDDELQKVFKEFKINRDEIASEIEAIFQNTSKFPDIEEAAGAIDMVRDNNLPEVGLPAAGPKSKKKANQPTALEVFTTDLTDKHTQETIDPVIGREEEIERLVHILCRRTKNNPVLVGEPGVGKTAIIEGLAKRISEGNIPDVLKRKKIRLLDLTLLVAGTIYRGEFEARLKQLIDEVKQKPDCILFIDEIHNIIGAGSNQGTMDAANMLKPALARGQLRCIGATTVDEYKKHISSDPALERRFQAITVDEPSAIETKRILQGIKKYYENFHHVLISDEAIDTAVSLSQKYIHDNYLPDKAIDLLDEASSAVKSTAKNSTAVDQEQKILAEIEECQKKKELAIHKEKYEEAIDWKENEKKLSKKLAELQLAAKSRATAPKKKVTGKDVAMVVSRKLKIEPKILFKNEWEQLSTIEKTINSKIIGQEQATAQISQTLRRAYIGLKKEKHPFASFLFVGPSGVGKTEMAKILAKELYHDEKALIKLDMSEFAESHSISKLLGSPVGYVGYKERNRFTDELRRRPYAVLLFDEFDKAHPDVQKLLFQILDEGEMTDSQGKKIHFEHTVIVLTGNIGTEVFKSPAMGFAKVTKERDAANGKTNLENRVLEKVKEEFGAPLLGRLDSICIFKPLNTADVKKILDLHIEELNSQLKKLNKFSISTEEKAMEQLAKEAYTPDTGVRNIDSTLSNVVHNLIVQILENKKQKKSYTLIKKEGKYQLV